MYSRDLSWVLRRYIEQDDCRYNHCTYFYYQFFYFAIHFQEKPESRGQVGHIVPVTHFPYWLCANGIPQTQKPVPLPPRWGLGIVFIKARQAERRAERMRQPKSKPSILRKVRCLTHQIPEIKPARSAPEPENFIHHSPVKNHQSKYIALCKLYSTGIPFSTPAHAGTISTATVADSLRKK